MLGTQFFSEVEKVIQKARDTQMNAIRNAAELVSQAIIEGKRVFIFGCSHAAILAEELFFRAGGLMLINPIFGPGLTLDEHPVTRTSQIERLEGYAKVLLDQSTSSSGDVLILASTSGRNPVPVEMALEAKARGMRLIVLTSLAYSTAVTSRHRTGKKVYQLADVVLDNCGIIGDAVLAVEGLPQKICPTSNIVGAIILHAMVAEVVETLLKNNISPPVFISANLDGAELHNTELMRKYHDKISYL